MNDRISRFQTIMLKTTIMAYFSTIKKVYDLMQNDDDDYEIISSTLKLLRHQDDVIDKNDLPNDTKLHLLHTAFKSVNYTMDDLKEMKAYIAENEGKYNVH